MLKEGKIIEELDINGKLHLFIVSFFEMDYILNYLIYAFIYIFSRARLLVELADDGRGRRIVERLPEPVEQAVCDNQQPERRHEPRGEDAEAEHEHARDDHPLTVQQVRRHARERHAQPVGEREHRGDKANLRRRHAQRHLYRTQRGAEHLSRPLLQEKRHPQERKRQPLVVSAVLVHCFILTLSLFPECRPHASPSGRRGRPKSPPAKAAASNADVPRASMRASRPARTGPDRSPPAHRVSARRPE